MEKVDVLIVGQGLSGTWLGWWLHKTGLSFKIIDQSNKNSASRRAAGLINPVTAMVCSVAPPSVRVTLPEILPGGAVAAERMYTGTLLMAPAEGVRVTLLP